MNDALLGGFARPLAAAALALSVATSGLSAQATVRTKENFRSEPNGLVLGVLDAGAPLSVLGHRDKWVEVEVRGWVWIRSLQATKKEGMDLVVSADDGENLRAQPSGAILGHMERGTLLEEEERIPGWVRITRRGWMWAPSVNERLTASSTAAVPAATPPEPKAPASSRLPGPTKATATKATAGAPKSAPSPGVPAGAPRLQRTGAGGAAVLASPDGDTLATARAGTDLTVLARQGNWARVKVEGWVWLPPGDTASGRGEPTSVGPSEVARDPDAYRGRLVTWDLQFVSSERAEKVRTDFYDGEPFLLTRHGEGLFVYVAVPPDRLDEVQGLVPLERITVVGRIRVGASELTGSPIVDLVELRRGH